jgi:cob(I)alamin adenosyltransferase
MLYTRKGDGGTTKTFGCEERMSKSSKVAEALGTLDELNSYIGLCRAELAQRGGLKVPVGARIRMIDVILHDIQQTLFIVQAEVASAPKKIAKPKVVALETITDSIEKVLPPIHSFLLAGGTKESALLDVARTVARRAERAVVAMHEEGVQTVGVYTLAYLNRLSSVLYALVRFVNHVSDVSEEAPTYS